ncbi:MAG: SpaH/EbpB family LPXTG-anchored major pilin [Lachnospiraceae bacterium]|nr:SpaH/EbpB family LPXTG-anchored major pilin [Lachnospiraceae bacterium]MCI9383509.1 SpaH/EbpB family LPXTG-anchored major pilin [Lachnospiraceae bacterium]
MKRMKKLLSFALAMVLVLAMGLPVMAAGDGEITVTGALAGQEYKIYKIFDLESHSTEENEDERAFAYKVTDALWKEFVTNGAGKDYVTVDAQGYITWIGDASAERAQEFAKLALTYAKDKKIGATATKIAVEGETLVFSGLELGYYLVDSNTGALCSLDTTQPKVEMQEKNEKTTTEKEVKDKDGNWGDENTASIGDVLDFQVKINVKKGSEKYVLHDVMSEGLTFGGKVTVTLLPEGETDATKGTLVGAENYELKTSNLEDGCTFEVVFNEAYCTSLTPGSTLVVSYQATVNENANIGKDPETNKATLDFGEGNTTEESETKTYVYEFDVEKYTMKDNEEVMLAGAKFTLSTNADGTNPITFSQDKEDPTVYKVDKNSQTSEITTGDTGKLTFRGLAAGTYYLTEIEAPAGYNMLPRPIEIQIIEKKDPNTGKSLGEAEIKQGMLNEENESTIEDTTSPVETVKVLNNTGAELPSTGGIGTTIFYVLGGILVVGAGIMLVVKKRMSSEK